MDVKTPQAHEGAVSTPANTKPAVVAHPPAAVAGTLVPIAKPREVESGGLWPITAEWALVCVTVLLMIYTGLLYRWTKKLAGDAAKTADEAKRDAASARSVMAAQQTAMERQADAAKAMASAAMVSERAFVYLAMPGMKDVNAGEWTTKSWFTFAFTNLGKTPAEVESLDSMFGVWEPGEIESLTAHPDGVQHRLDFFLGNDVTSEPIRRLIRPTNDADIGRVYAKKAVLAAIGRLWYSDVFANRWEYGFAIRWTPEMDRLTTIQNHSLNYTRPCNELGNRSEGVNRGTMPPAPLDPGSPA